MLKEGLIIEHNRNIWKTLVEEKTYNAIINNSYEGNTLPVVGDIVTIDIDEQYGSYLIKNLNKRRTELSRNNNGKKQVIASNIDYVFITTSMNKEFNIGKIERLYLLGKKSGANILFVLTKSDITDDKDYYINLLKNRFKDEPVIAVSSNTGEGIDELLNIWKKNQIGVFIGSSGVGKSTLINTIANKKLSRTKEVRKSDDKGRHTTTGTTYYILDDGRMIIDSPGIRNVGIYNINEEDIKEVFEVIESAKNECKYKNCTHQNEDGCKVKELLEEGIISTEMYARYQKMIRQKIMEERRYGIDDREDFEKEKDLRDKKKKSANFKKRKNMKY